MMNVGIIGLGSFGCFMIGHLKRHFDITVFDKNNSVERAGQLGVKFGTIREAASRDVVIISVPSGEMQSVLEEIRLHVRQGAIIVDVASVKKMPVSLMKHFLPENVDIIGTHPLFGPQSAEDGISGKTIVVCPVRCGMLDRVTAFLENKLGLVVMIDSAEEHDRHMAYVQGLTHFIVKALKSMDLPTVPYMTSAYEHVLALVRLLGSDSEELFFSIEKDNQFSSEIRKKFLSALDRIHESLEQ